MSQTALRPQLRRCSPWWGRSAAGASPGGCWFDFPAAMCAGGLPTRYLSGWGRPLFLLQVAVEECQWTVQRAWRASRRWQLPLPHNPPNGASCPPLPASVWFHRPIGVRGPCCGVATMTPRGCAGGGRTPGPFKDALSQGCLWRCCRPRYSLRLLICTPSRGCCAVGPSVGGGRSDPPAASRDRRGPPGRKAKT